MDERRALDALRNIKSRVREIKKRLSGMEGVGDEEMRERATLEMELKRLRSEWKAWEEKRDQAARERMIRLGHTEPD
jgi:regulator of replication initiation timing